MSLLKGQKWFKTFAITSSILSTAHVWGCTHKACSGKRNGYDTFRQLTKVRIVLLLQVRKMY